MASSQLKVETPGDEIGMSVRIRAFDWSRTPLGPIESWPTELRIVLSIAEHSSFPAAIYWGPELRLLYNDAWAFIPGERHPAALGQPAKDVWSDIWAVVGPQFEEVMTTGEGITALEQMLPIVRDGVEQETYWNYSFTPITDPAGKVLGVFNQGNEITRAVINERRLAFQVQVADRLRSLSKPEDVWVAAATLLGEHLGAARVGFAEVDEADDRVTILREWRQSETVPSLQGRTTPLSDLPPAAIAHVKSGQVLALADVDKIAQGSSSEDAELGARLGVRAVVTVPLLRRERLRAFLYVHHFEPRSWKRSEAAMARDVAERGWAAVERAKSEERLRESEDHYRHTVELNPQVTWTALPDGQLNRVSRRWYDWTGTSGLGETWAEGLHPDDRQRTFAVWANCVATGQPYDIEHRVQMIDGCYRWARSRAFPRYDESGNIRLWYGSTEDIHEQKLAEERQRLLINELNHRVKNTLATVQAIAFQTLKGEIPLSEARARFEARLLALSRAHNLLTEESWEGASLRRVIADTTAYLAGDGERFEIDGEPVFLSPRAALALSLALHELSTNAVKYGALSGEEGKVSIKWTLTDETLRLDWKEMEGPPVVKPERRGFGSRLIERGLEADLAGHAELHFEPDGLRCVIEASRDAIHGREANDG